jgi:hypothetical protein
MSFNFKRGEFGTFAEYINKTIRLIEIRLSGCYNAMYWQVFLSKWQPASPYAYRLKGASCETQNHENHYQRMCRRIDSFPVPLHRMLAIGANTEYSRKTDGKRPNSRASRNRRAKLRRDRNAE